MADSINREFVVGQRFNTLREWKVQQDKLRHGGPSTSRSANVLQQVHSLCIPFEAQLKLKQEAGQGSPFASPPVLACVVVFSKALASCLPT